MRPFALISSLFVLWVLASPANLSDTFRDQTVRFEAHQQSLHDVALPKVIDGDFEPERSIPFTATIIPLFHRVATALVQHEQCSGSSAHPRLHLILRVLRN